MAGTPYFCVHMRLEMQLSRQKTYTTMDVRKRISAATSKESDTRFLLFTLSYANERVAVQIISLKWYILILIFTIKVVIRICFKSIFNM